MSLQVSHRPIGTVVTNVELNNNNNRVNTAEGFVIIDTIQSNQTNNVGSSMNPINRTITEGGQSVVRSKMDKALDVLNAIEKACDAQTKAQLDLNQKTQHIGIVKNLFYKFLGIFSKSLETEKRTQALNAKLHSIAARLKDDKNLYNGVLLSTLNDTKLDASLKTTCFKLYDDDPDTQDKLFKSLKEPPKEIRENFWERNGEKILNGELFGFKPKNANAEGIKSEFMSVKGEPLKSLFIKNMSAAECKNLNEYRNVFENSDLPNTFTKEEHVETFLTSYFSVTEEHAKTLLQEDIEAGKVEDLNEQHRQNADKIIGILLKDNPVDLRSTSVLPFRELFQGGEKRFTFTVEGKTICDIDSTKLKKLAEQKAPDEQKHLNELLELAKSKATQAQTKFDQAPEGSEEEDKALSALRNAEEELKHAEANIKNYKPTVTLKDFFDEIKTQIKGKNIDEASVQKLALFLASGISVMPPVQNGRGICNMDRCHCSCMVSEDGTLTINQKFDKVKSNQNGELFQRFTNAMTENVVFKSVGEKCYTETSMEIEHTFDLFTSGSRTPKTAELKSLDCSIKFTD